MRIIARLKYAYGYTVLRVTERAPILKMDQPETAEKYWRTVIEKEPWFDPEKECLVALLLNTKYDVKGHSMVSIGSLNETSAHPREIFRVAVVTAAYAIVVMHNHPSGDPLPSQTDCSLTEQIERAGAILQIRVMDHVIIGQARRASSKARTARRYGRFSFKEAGLLV